MISVRFGATRAAVCTVLAVLTAGSFFSRPASAAPLKIGYSDWPGYLVWEVAKQKDMFKQEGVDVDLVWFEYGPCLDAFAAGKIDAAAIVSGDALVTGASGKPSTCIVLEDYSNGNDMIVGKPGIKTFADLKGKKVGLEQNLVEHLLLLKGMAMNGMKDSDITIVNVPTNETPQTLASGGVDAIGAWYPVSGQALRQVPGARPIFTSAQAPGLIFDGLFVSRESLSQHRDEWTKVVAVWFKAMDYVQDPKTHDDAVKIMSARVNVKANEFEKSMKGTALLSRQGNVNSLILKDDTLNTVIGSMKNANTFNLEHKVYKDSQDATTYVDASIVKEMLKK